MYERILNQNKGSKEWREKVKIITINLDTDNSLMDDPLESKFKNLI